ncbi:hypothetical protein L596_023193 [Steinernema carpocapsae]|uniref:RRM domain-containing protein n=1 Tax=Steinernema carpocapsae TaxID=34508 RepID=A0A4U5MDQ2_STECR|nr:hypothetical protein L596_023193 [Steinernema carpocapsae]
MDVVIGQIVNLNFEESDGSASPTPPNHAIPVLEQKKRKLFLGGLRYQTNEEHIRQYFEDHLKCETSEIHVNRHKETGKPKHFALVTLKNVEDVDKVLMQPHHFILGRNIEIKKAGRTYLPGMPPQPTRYHPMDPLCEDKPFMNDGEPPKRYPNQVRRSKYGFHDYVDEERRLKKWQETDKGDWNMGKARLDNADVRIMHNNSRQFPKSASNGPSTSATAFESDSAHSTRSAGPNRFAGLGNSRLFGSLVKKQKGKKADE